MALMGLEFAGLVGVGAACLARQQPTMCNGANLAYRRAAFEAVGGYADNAHLASGDDEFLLHKIHAAFPGTAAFPGRCGGHCAHGRARHAAGAAAAAGALGQQVAALPQRRPAPPGPAGAGGQRGAGRRGWGGAGLARRCGPGWRRPGLLKLGADAWFLAPVLRFFGRRRWLWGLLPLQLLYAPYALAVGLAGWRGGYEWKGRAVR